VNVATPGGWAPATNRDRWFIGVLLILGSSATAVTALASNGNIAATAAPVIGTTMLVALWFIPLRIPLLALTFLSLALDSTNEEVWNTPFAPLGRLLTHNLNKTIPIDALAVPLAALIIGYLFVIHVSRRLSVSAIDGVGPKTMRPMMWSLLCSLVAALALCGLGFKRGGDLQMAKNQVQFFVLLLSMAYLLTVSLRDSADIRVLGKVLLAAACAKALLALWIASPFLDLPRPLPFATHHGDSMLFAGVAMMLIARVSEQPSRHNLKQGILFLPVLIAAMVVNNRRLAWVEMVVSMVILLVLSRNSRLKRFVTRTLTLCIPFALVYVAAGWNSQGRIFAPVRAFRSVQDSDVDRSTLYRDVENYNLLYTLRMNPILGTGFGHPYSEEVKSDDISFFKEYLYLPHNSVLGLWAFGGVIGFTGLWAALAVGVFFAARGYNHSELPDDRAAALTALIMVMIYEIQCWGDIGFSEKRSVFLVGAALAVSSQFAALTRRRRPTRPRLLAGERV
jgi:hypothetical protein